MQHQFTLTLRATEKSHSFVHEHPQLKHAARPRRYTPRAAITLPANCHRAYFQVGDDISSCVSEDTRRCGTPHIIFRD